MGIVGRDIDELNIAACHIMARHNKIENFSLVKNREKYSIKTLKLWKIDIKIDGIDT